MLMKWNAKQTRTRLGETLGRRGPLSGRSLRTLINPGLPVGLIGEPPFHNAAVMELCLEALAGLPLASLLTPSTVPLKVAAPAPRRRGRPRKHVD